MILNMDRRSSWLFVDLIEDKIKNRGIFITVTLLFYVYITWRLIVGFPSIDRTPASIESSIDMPRSMYMGIAISEQRSLRIKVKNIHGESLSGISVSINLIKISTNAEKLSTPIWDFDHRIKIEGSLDYIRFHEVWKVELFGNEDIKK